MSDNGPQQPGIPQIMGQPLMEEQIVHDFWPNVTKIGPMTLLHLDVAPGRRITVKLASDEAVDKIVSMLKGIHIARGMP